MTFNCIICHRLRLGRCCLKYKLGHSKHMKTDGGQPKLRPEPHVPSTPLDLIDKRRLVNN